MNPMPHPVDPLLAKYIRFKPDVTKGIEREYQVTITAADVGIITISPTPTSPSDWPEKAIEMMHDVISSSLTKIDMPVPPEVSGTVYPMVMKACNDEGLKFAFGQGSNKVAIAGHVDAVMKLQHDVNEMCSRMIKTTGDVKLLHEDYIYFKSYSLPCIQQMYSAVKLQCHDDHLSVSVNGSIKDVHEVKAQLPQYLHHIKVPVNLRPEALSFLHDDASGKQVLASFVKSSLNVISYFSFDDQLVLFLLCPEEFASEAETIAMNIQQDITVEPIDLPQSFSRHVSNSKFASFQTKLSEKYPFSASIQQKKLVLVSTRNSIAAVSKEFQVFISELCSITDTSDDDDDDDTSSPFKDMPPTLETAPAIPMNPIPHALDPLLAKYVRLNLLKSKEKEMEDKKREFHQKMEEKNKEVLVLQEKDAKKDREIQQLCLLLKQREKDEEQEIQRYRRQLQEKEMELQEAVHICQQQVLTDDHWVINKDEVILTEEELGRGSYATVKVGIFRGLRVAVKSLHTIIISNYNLALFSREMIVASRVRHPNLIQFIGATKVGNPLILTELMSTSLHKELQKKQFTKQQIVSIAQDVALGLNYLHLFKPQPIIHRDVSSPNVLLKPCIGLAGYEAKVADYGTAKLQKGISSGTVMPGNPAYAAPEARDPEQHSPGMDVYSYSVVLMEMTLYSPPEMTIIERERQARNISWPAMKSIIQSGINASHKARPSMDQVLKKLSALKIKIV